MPNNSFLKPRPIERIALVYFLISILIVLFYGRPFCLLLAEHLGAVAAYSSWLLPCFFAKIVFALRGTPQKKANAFYLTYFFLLTLSFFGTRIEMSLAQTMLLRQTSLIVTYQNAINLTLLALTVGYVARRWAQSPAQTRAILKIELTDDLLAVRLLVSVLLAFIIYSNLLALVPLIHPGLFDGFFLKLDKLFFLGHNPFPWVNSFNDSVTRTLMEKSYEFFFFFIVFGLTGTFLLGGIRPYEKTVAGLVLIYLVGLVCFIAWPTVGPAFYEETSALFRASGDNALKHYLLGKYILFCRDPQHAVIGAFNGMAAFPSLHIAHSTFFMICLWRVNRWVVALLVIPYLLLGMSTVYLGWHYFADILGGLALAWGTFLLVERIHAGPRPAAGAATENTEGENEEKSDQAAANK